jgi:basic amino acid/polyamine antiporter, APA family
VTSGLSVRAVFAIVYATTISSVYFALGVVAGRALGLTPLVFAFGAVFFALTALTYVEASTLHQEPGGSTVFSRYAFNELVSFVSGWAVVLDYVILVAVTAVAATNYAATFWSPLGHGALEVILALGIIGVAAYTNVMGIPARALQARAVLAAADLLLQTVLVLLGLVLVFDPHVLSQAVDFGAVRSWQDVAFALTVATIAFTGLEAAAGLAGEVHIRRSDLKRLVGGGAATIIAVYVGIAVVAISALPVHGGHTQLADRYLDRPVVGLAHGLGHGAIADVAMYAVAVAAVIMLVTATNAAMLGVSRVALSLATHRQIPTALGRLHPTRGTPWVVIGSAALIAAGLAIPTDVDFLVGLYAFGAMLAFTIAHAAVVVLRFREPRAERAYRIPLSVTVRGAEVPLPAVLGGLLSLLGFLSVVLFHAGARAVGLGWMLAGLILYVAYRRTGGTPLFEQVRVSEQILRVPAEALEPEFGSILVPIFGSDLDVDIIQTAGRLAGDERDDLESEGAVIEALWVFEVPMALPLDARLPEAQLQRAREALARAKAVGEEYEGVEVATATVRARRAGQAIVDEAGRRGVEAIVLAAEPPSRVRGGARLGGTGGPLDDFVGDVTKYVLRKAQCRVILTAPAAEPAAESKDESSADTSGRRTAPAAASGATLRR